MTVQRDETWLQTASTDDISTAYEAGELNALLGRPTPEDV